jgi:protein-disulfide isomerase
MHLVLSDLMKSYGDRVKVVYKDFPLMEIHPWAERAAIDSGCLAKQSGAAYWDFADYVHANGKQIQGDQRAVAAQLNEVDRITVDAGRRHSADLAALDGCIKAQNKSDLKASMKEAEGLGVEATPVMFVDGMKIDGAVPAEEVKLVLDKELRNVGDSAPAGVVAAPPGN